MTEGHESDFLVRVRAQVMTRDESTEGWLPLAGGGLANVSIRKRARLSPGAGGHEYIIYGQRISDQNVILSCVINCDLKYFKVMPTFHHWRAGKQRNGLTFQTAADARAFDKGVLRAYKELIDGYAKTNPSWSTLQKYDSVVVEDDVFMSLNLPVEPAETQSSPEGNGSYKSGLRDNKDRDRDKPNIHYISCDKTPPLPPTSISNNEQPSIPGDNYSYVQLTVLDCNYPVVDEPVTAQVINARRDSTCSLKKHATLDVPPSSLKDTVTLHNRTRCRYCHEFYTEEWNRKGACEFSPDYFKSGLECISGMGCARCMLYHCMSDAEGETPSHPCECVSESGCTKRWIGLTLLSLVVPCLWCYPPLRACHWVGVSCGVCGGKHKPQV